MAFFSLGFRSGDYPKSWVGAGCALPNGLCVTRFGGAVAECELKPLDGRDVFEELPEDVHLHGQDFVIYVGPSFAANPWRAYWDIDVCGDVSQHWIAAHARALFLHFQGSPGYYGFACDHEEWLVRHRFGYDQWGTGRLSTCPVGRDYARYVPGLYWLNYFSKEYMIDHKLDVEQLARYLRGTLEQLQNGVLLQLYNKPGQWEEYSEEVDQLLFHDQRFFSIKRIERPEPMSLSPPEFDDFAIRLGKEWP
jgi:hypothetical protein